MLKNDAKFNHIGLSGLIKSLLFPTPFNAVVWVRFYLWLEKIHFPTFIAYRYLLHIHGLEFAKNVKIGEGLRIPHSRGVLFTKGTRIGKNCSIYGNVRFTRNYDNVPSIGDNVLIGDSVVLTGKGNIGNNVIIGAGSVVTKTFGDNVIIAGNPARVITERSALKSN
jgi:serine acetyltransferase